MVKVITLEPGDPPPLGASSIVMEWSMGTVTSYMIEGRSIHYVIGQPKHRFWSMEAILLAVRMGFDEIYYIGRPSAFAWPSDTRGCATTPPSASKTRRKAGRHKQAAREKAETRASL